MTIEEKLKRFGELKWERESLKAEIDKMKQPYLRGIEKAKEEGWRLLDEINYEMGMAAGGSNPFVYFGRDGKAVPADRRNS